MGCKSQQSHKSTLTTQCAHDVAAAGAARVEGSSDTADEVIHALQRWGAGISVVFSSACRMGHLWHVERRGCAIRHDRIARANVAAHAAHRALGKKGFVRHAPRCSSAVRLADLHSMLS